MEMKLCWGHQLLSCYFITAPYLNELPNKNKYELLRENDKKGAKIHLIKMIKNKINEHGTYNRRGLHSPRLLPVQKGKVPSYHLCVSLFPMV